MFRGLNTCVWLLSGVSLCALIGLLAIQRINSSSSSSGQVIGPEGPIEHFSIVVDGGSTKTSSALMQYKINLDANSKDSFTGARMASGTNKNSSVDNNLANFMKIMQLSHCKNGGPLTEIETIQDAHNLLDHCNQRYLDQIETRGSSKSNSQPKMIEGDESPSALSLAETRLYLGVTAGMRTLRSVDDREAQRKISLVQQAAREELIERQQATRNAISVGRMEILSEEEEAAYAWISANFQTNLLKFNQNSAPASLVKSLETLGTVEMGGSSVQMAHEIDEKNPKESKPINYYSLDLFGIRYPLVARSEKCLGIAQGKSRAKLHIIRQYLRDKLGNGRVSMQDNELILENSCWSGEDETLTRDQLEKIIAEPCMLVPTDGIDPIVEFLRENKQFQSLKLVAKLHRERCDAIIANLLDAQYCQVNFRLCLTRQVDPNALPQGMVFIAVANFNLVVKGLGMKQAHQDSSTEIEKKVAREFNYHSVDHDELDEKLTRLCKVNGPDIPKSFPVKDEHASSACFTFSYIDKLLTDFYGFSPRLGKWKQLKFNLDSQGPLMIEQRQAPVVKPVNFGWQIGMVLKETSELLRNPEENYLLLANENNRHHQPDKIQNFILALRRHNLLIGLAIFNLILVLAVVSIALVKSLRPKQSGQAKVGRSANQASIVCHDSDCLFADHYRLEVVAISGATEKPGSYT